MKIVLLGASGMVGQGVLRECLLDPEVEQVLCIGRSSLGRSESKIRELVTANLADLSNVEGELSGYDACLFCLGVSAAGMSEADYRRTTYDLTLSVAKTLLKQNPGLSFLYVSGAGTDSSERGRAMWARVKGATENALLSLPFKGAYMFRPGVIQPRHGIRSKTALYQFFYSTFGLLIPVVKALFPNSVMSTEELGLAMIQVAKHGHPKRVLEARDVNTLLKAATPAAG